MTERISDDRVGAIANVPELASREEIDDMARDLCDARERLDWVMDTVLINGMNFPFDASIVYDGEWPGWFLSDLAERYAVQHNDLDADWRWAISAELGIGE